MRNNEKLLALVLARLRADFDNDAEWLARQPRTSRREAALIDYARAKAANAVDANWLARQSPAARKAIAALDCGMAKQRALEGDLEPLRQIVTERIGDPDLARFIARPPQPKHVRRDYAREKPFEKAFRCAQADTVRRVREILQEKTGKARGIDVVEIAVAILGHANPTLSREQLADKIYEIIKRGRQPNRRGPKARKSKGPKAQK